MEFRQIAAFDIKGSSVSADTIKEKKLRQACADFEAILVKQMLSIMRESIPKSELFDGGFQEEIYQSMYDQEIAKKIAYGKGIGVGEALYRQITGQQISKTGK